MASKTRDWSLPKEGKVDLCQQCEMDEGIERPCYQILCEECWELYLEIVAKEYLYD